MSKLIDLDTVTADKPYHSNYELKIPSMYCENDVLATEAVANAWAAILHENGNLCFKRPICVDIKKMIFHPPATIVYWADGSKTVVKCKKDEEYDPEKGLAMAISKRVLDKNYRKTFKNLVKEGEVTP